MTQVAERPDVREMVIVHRVFRREFGLAPRLVRAVLPGDVARAGTVAAHLTELGTMLHHHHTGEDELLWPRLHERAALHDELVTRMEQQHERVGGLLAEIDALLPRWASGADAALRDELAGVYDRLAPALEEHLAEEEREVLPLVEQHVTAAEWAQLGERGMAGIPRARLLVVLGHLLEEASPEERASFLAHAPAAARLAYRLVGRRKFEKEVAALRQGVTVPAQRSG